ncbi:MAG: thioredoxin family protein [Verrucomicrobiota bacterium]
MTTATLSPSISSAPRIVSREEWLSDRRALLAQEKALTREYDRLRGERRKLPWVRVEEDYRFEGPDGQESLSDLFAGRSQLIVYHFMLGPGWEEGCVGCSFLADHLDGAIQHLENHDVTVVVVSRAPLAELEAFKKRMGWKFKWVSSHDSDFNFDYQVSFTPEQMAQERKFHNFEWTPDVIEELSGTSVFAKDGDGGVFHTYSAYARGDEQLIGAYMLLDLTPKGRNENGPRRNLTDWARHHDRYDAGGRVAETGRYVPAENAASEVPSSAGCGCACGVNEEAAS